MTIERKLTGTVDAAASEAVYIEDTFSTFLYTGTGASQTITNGIDLATKGGLVWTKVRSTTFDNRLVDTAIGSSNTLTSNATNANTAVSTGITAFSTTGYTLGTASQFNGSGNTFTSWTFRKQPKFFDIVTYTGTLSARTISHALGSTPGMIIVKRTDASSNWQVYHRGLTSADNSIQLNLTNAQASATTVWNSTTPTSSVFSVGTDATVNASGGTYVAYLFAHDAGGFGAAGTDSVVSCGSFTDLGGTATVNLGWEPQFVLLKRTNGTGDWFIYDNMRGWPVSGDSLHLNPNTSSAEAVRTVSSYKPPMNIRQNGFFWESLGTSETYIYLAIRRGPMKTPTDATKVFAPIASSASTGTKITTGFPVDLHMNRPRGGATTVVGDRLRGLPSTTTESIPTLFPSSPNAEFAGSDGRNFGNDGFEVPSGLTGQASVYWNFRRAPGFFDVVCYTGTGNNQSVSHNLGVVPELAFIKSRNEAFTRWIAARAGGTGGSLNENWAFSSGFLYVDLSSATSTTFPVTNASEIGKSGNTYVAYLFATCPGVSKVGSYTGNGSSQTIDCGFTNGARFVLIKRTDSTGDWWVYDSARGIVSANDPALQLNSTAAEVTSADAVDPASSGFIVNQETTCNINVSSATYIYLSVA